MPDAKTDFEKNIPSRISADPDKAKNIGAIFLFKISGDEGGTWTLDLKENVGVQEGEHGSPECTIEMTDADWKEMSDNPQAAGVPRCILAEVSLSKRVSEGAVAQLAGIARFVRLDPNSANGIGVKVCGVALAQRRCSRGGGGPRGRSNTQTQEGKTEGF